MFHRQLLLQSNSHNHVLGKYFSNNLSKSSKCFVSIPCDSAQLCHMCMLGVSGLVVECRTRSCQVAGSNLTAGHLQATLSKLLTYGVLRSTQPPTLRGMGNE